MESTITLADDSRMPRVGLGLWKIDRDETAQLVVDAIAAGYRHLDSAADYGNESEAGLGIRRALEAGLCRREELWVTSKLWNTFHHPEHVRPACEKTLSDLGLDYLDLYLVHFPISLRYVDFATRYPPQWLFHPDQPLPAMEIAPVPLSETWAAMEELVELGLVRRLGVCNYSSGLLHDLFAYARIRPTVLQIESHPYLTQAPLLRLAEQYGMAVTAFSPLGALSYVSLDMAAVADSVLNEPAVAGAAARVGRSPAQVVLRWALQRGAAVIPKTSRKEPVRATPLCRSGWLLARIRERVPEFVARCERLGVRYINIMAPGEDMESGQGRGWRSTLGANTIAEAEHRLRALGYGWSWLEGGSLRACTPVLPAVRTLASGKRVFFNQLIAAWRGWSDRRNESEKSICFGDHSEIPSADMEAVVEAAREVTVDLHWQAGDMVLVDNMQVMHGRLPYRGRRQILASLAA